MCYAKIFNLDVRAADAADVSRTFNSCRWPLLLVMSSKGWKYEVVDVLRPNRDSRRRIDAMSF